MIVDAVYGVVIVGADGGQRMNSFGEEDAANREGERIVREAKELQEKGKLARGIKIYLSVLDYSKKKNLILSERLVDENSKLLYESS